MSRLPALIALSCSRRTWESYVADIVVASVSRVVRLVRNRSVGKWSPQEASSIRVVLRFFACVAGFFLKNVQAAGGRSEGCRREKERGTYTADKSNAFAV